ncbi:hypothetical protein [Alteromonas sp. 14N.309.X.WAT.G.H12]|uniref:hypothetical protein n=1 Tax=Alteromonas sp. 14N.309.X.WAT.G.H12 TaxID=3120824 RepID=UPI002FD1AF2F
MSNQNSALNFLFYLQSLVYDGQLKVDVETNPKVLYMGNDASMDFLYGRDQNNEPYIGIQSEFMPWFTHVDWFGVSICRKKGYVFLDAKDNATNILQMSLGIRIRKERMDCLCMKGVEDPDEMRLSFRVYEVDDDDPTSVLFSDRKVLSNLYIREIEDVDELASDIEAEDARGVFAKSGLDSTLTSVKIGGESDGG